MMDGVNVSGYGEIPYYTKEFAETCLRMTGIEILLDSTEEDLNINRTSPAISVLTGPVTTTAGITSAPLPANTIKVLSAAIDGAPAAYASPANFIQRLPGGSRTSNCFTYIEGKLAFKGAAVSATLLVEPTMTEWQNNENIIPPDRDMEHIDRAVSRMKIADLIPTRE